VAVTAAPSIGRRTAEPARVGVFGIGLAAYWDQFDGLRERLEGYQGGLERRLRGLGADVVSAGLVDTPEAARAAGARLAEARVGLILLYTATYATSSQVLPVAQELAARLAQGPTAAYAAIKRQLAVGGSGSLTDALAAEAAAQQRAGATADHREATAAFVAKRPPIFTGA